MDIDKTDIAGLFDKPQRYVVPLFQRAYVWSLEAQWRPLWEDIVSQIEFIRQESGRSRPKERKHFLGALVLGQMRKVPRQIAGYLVIDGQQRLTTLQILLCALRDAIKPLSSDYLNSSLERLTENPTAGYEPHERYKVWPTNIDRVVFERVMTAGSKAEVERLFPQQTRRRKKLPRPLFVEAYLFFTECVLNFITPDAVAGDVTPELAVSSMPSSVTASPNTEITLDQDRAEELLDAIQRHLQLVSIILDESEDPQVIFETLNARGEPLLPSDLIRNFVFLSAAKRNSDDQTLYDNYWKPFDEAPGPIKHKGDVGLFWKDGERRGRLRRSRLDLFFFNLIAAKTGDVFKVEHLFDEFRRWWNDIPEGTSIEETLEEFLRAAKTYRALLEPDRGTTLGRFASCLQALDISTAYPLVLFLDSARAQLGESDFLDCLVDIESYVVRRAVCDLTAKGYNRLFLSIVTDLRKVSQLTRDIVRARLASGTGESNEWPDDHKFREAWLRRPLYKQLGPVVTRMLLLKLDEALQGVKQEQVIVRLEDLTVEHVRPQNPRESDWPYPADKAEIPSDSLAQYSRIAARSIVSHTIGNLTLLTQPLNSSVSNGPFSAKRAAIAAQSRLLLNAYFQRFRDEAPWDEGAILSRGAELFELARRVWPRPVSQ